MFGFVQLNSDLEGSYWNATVLQKNAGNDSWRNQVISHHHHTNITTDGTTEKCGTYYAAYQNCVNEATKALTVGFVLMVVGFVDVVVRSHKSQGEAVHKLGETIRILMRSG